MTLTDGMTAPPGQAGYMGMSIYKGLIDAAKKRGVKIRIVQQKPDARMPAYDTGNLTALGVAEVRSIDFAAVNGYNGMGGILHTKLMVVDGKHAYIGSANMGAFPFSLVHLIVSVVLMQLLAGDRSSSCLHCLHCHQC